MDWLQVSLKYFVLYEMPIKPAILRLVAQAILTL